jgi:5-methyltetrahydropteroyltriglutamate--homocysteine methyltransferase
MEKVILKATSEILKLQEEIGIDVVTDGELKRENYVYYFCRKLNGFDFEKLTKVTLRDGAYTSKLPTITGPVSSKEKDPWIWREWLAAQEMSKKPVKVTLPAPLTIINTCMNEYYKDNERELSKILVKEINNEVVALSKAGCKYIQVYNGYPIPSK